MSRVSVSDDGCWLWTGGKFTNGYGMVRIQEKLRRAHRVMYVWTRGELPEDLQIDHTCKVKACVNPLHMEAVTLRENVRRSNGWGGVESRKTHCENGHELTPENTARRGDPSRGWRECRQCQRDKSRRYRERHSQV